MLRTGYIKLHRSILDWEWYKNSNTVIIFFHLLITANYEQKNFQGEVINVGERVASYASLSDETGLSIQSVKTAIKHLKSTGEITSRSNNKYTVFTVTNYSRYQGEQQAKQQATNKQTTSKQQATNNNVRKYKKDKKEKEYKKFLSDRRAALLTNSQKSELVSLSSVESVETYEQKILEWQSKTGKRCRDPFETIKGWIAQDKARGPADKETSYDMDEYMSIAANYDFDNGGDDE